MPITPLMPVYPRSPVRPVRGEGVYLFGEKGEKYLDFASGIAVAPPGPRSSTCFATSTAPSSGSTGRRASPVVRR